MHIQGIYEVKYKMHKLQCSVQHGQHIGMCHVGEKVSACALTVLRLKREKGSVFTLLPSVGVVMHHCRDAPEVAPSASTSVTLSVKCQ